jgi:Uma2 family endonuclease
MKTTTTHLVTVEEFRRLPEDSGPVYHELRHGQVIAVTRPKHRHYRIQRRLSRLLEDAAPPDSEVGIEFAFRPLPDYELRVADVAYVNPRRAGSIAPDDNLHGAPDLVVEVLSPSNTKIEIKEKEQLCLVNGCLEFWLVDPDRRVVTVSTADGRQTTYIGGESISSSLLGDAASIPVDAIFEKL